MAGNFELRGIVEIQYALERVAGLAEREIEAFVDDIVDDVHEQYVANLSGSVPSTAARPRPVGVRTGKLRAGAKKERARTNTVTGRTTGRVYDETPYAGFIEFGTRKMAPRQPLADALDQKAQVDSRMDRVMMRVVRG
jgi:hypothetical protein